MSALADLTPLTLIDVGSTQIKCVKLDDQGCADNHYRPIVENAALADQVRFLLTDLGQDKDGRIRICSSANGGLVVGMICLTKRFSGEIAAKLMQRVGANLRYIHDLRETRDPGAVPPVDVLVVVGGVDGNANPRAAAAFRELDLGPYRYQKLVFSGHSECAAGFAARCPGAVVVPNPMNGHLSATNDDLPDYVRQTYLDDIESKRDLILLSPVSEVPIEPTPAVVSRAFARIVARTPALDMIIDVGGATTDIHYTKDLVVEERIIGPLTAYLPVNRYVYTALGVFKSRASTIAALIDHPRCPDFLSLLYERDAQSRYVDLLEGRLPEDALFYACIFLALDELFGDDAAVSMEDPKAPPPLNINRVLAIGVTGGAAKVVVEEKLFRVLAGVMETKSLPRLVLDRDYRWWAAGLADEGDLTRLVGDTHA